MMTRWLTLFAAVVLVVAASAPAAAGPAHDLFGLTDVDAPIWPEQVPTFARADGSRYRGCQPRSGLNQRRAHGGAAQLQPGALSAQPSVVRIDSVARLGGSPG